MLSEIDADLEADSSSLRVRDCDDSTENVTDSVPVIVLLGEAESDEEGDSVIDGESELLAEFDVLSLGDLLDDCEALWEISFVGVIVASSSSD